MARDCLRLPGVRIYPGAGNPDHDLIASWLQSQQSRGWSASVGEHVLRALLFYIRNGLDTMPGGLLPDGMVASPGQDANHQSAESLSSLAMAAASASAVASRPSSSLDEEVSASLPAPGDEVSSARGAGHLSASPADGASHPPVKKQRRRSLTPDQKIRLDGLLDRLNEKLETEF